MAVSFIPATREQANGWQKAGRAEGPVAAHQVTPEFLEAFDIDATSGPGREAALFGCLCVASVSCLVTDSERLVLVVDNPSPWSSADGEDAEFGRGLIDGFSWADVTAFYVDGPDADIDVRAASQAVRGLSLNQAWDDNAVIGVLARHDLLWHDVAEWGSAGSH